MSGIVLGYSDTELLARAEHGDFNQGAQLYLETGLNRKSCTQVQLLDNKTMQL